MTQNLKIPKGLGDADALFNVYIANRPAFNFMADDQDIAALQKGEIKACGLACGNGWRKVFSVYAKLLFASANPIFNLQQHDCWQSYRDKALLQAGSKTSLIFMPPTNSDLQKSERLQSHSQAIHIIMGKTYAKSLALANRLEWLDNEFAINYEQRLIVCPYFDYRQLSNSKILRLVHLIHHLEPRCKSAAL